nr:titin-like [Lytechinus pictus]
MGATSVSSDLNSTSYLPFIGTARLHPKELTPTVRRDDSSQPPSFCYGCTAELGNQPDIKAPLFFLDNPGDSTDDDRLGIEHAQLVPQNGPAHQHVATTRVCYGCSLSKLPHVHVTKPRRVGGGYTMVRHAVEPYSGDKHKNGGSPPPSTYISDDMSSDDEDIESHFDAVIDEEERGILDYINVAKLDEPTLPLPSIPREKPLPIPLCIMEKIKAKDVKAVSLHERHCYACREALKHYWPEYFTLRDESDGSTSGVGTSIGSEALEEEERRQEERKRQLEEARQLRREEEARRKEEEAERRKNLYKPPKAFQLKKTEKKEIESKDPFSTDRNLNIPKSEGFKLTKTEKQTTKFIEHSRQETEWKEPKKFELTKTEPKTTKTGWKPPERLERLRPATPPTPPPPPKGKKPTVPIEPKKREPPPKKPDPPKQVEKPKPIEKPKPVEKPKEPPPQKREPKPEPKPKPAPKPVEKPVKEPPKPKEVPKPKEPPKEKVQPEPKQRPQKEPPPPPPKKEVTKKVEPVKTEPPKPIEKPKKVEEPPRKEKPEKEKPKPIEKEKPKPVEKEKPKPVEKEKPKPIVKEKPKPVVKETPKPVVKEQPKKEIRPVKKQEPPTKPVAAAPSNRAPPPPRKPSPPPPKEPTPPPPKDPTPVPPPRDPTPPPPPKPKKEIKPPPERKKPQKQKKKTKNKKQDAKSSKEYVKIPIIPYKSPEKDRTPPPKQELPLSPPDPPEEPVQKVIPAPEPEPVKPVSLPTKEKESKPKVNPPKKNRRAKLPKRVRKEVKPLGVAAPMPVRPPPSDHWEMPDTGPRVADISVPAFPVPAPVEPQLPPLPEIPVPQPAPKPVEEPVPEPRKRPMPLPQKPEPIMWRRRPEYKPKKKKWRKVEAGSPPSSPDPAVRDPLDYLAKYCIVHKERVPHYQRVFNTQLRSTGISVEDRTLRQWMNTASSDRAAPPRHRRPVGDGIDDHGAVIWIRKCNSEARRGQSRVQE